MNTFDNIHEAYLCVLAEIYNSPDYHSAPRGLPIREKVDYMFKILNPTDEAIVTKDLERNKTIADYTAKEKELYNNCCYMVDDFAQASKFWNKICNPDGTVNSAYGYLIWAKKSMGNFAYELDPKDINNINKAVATQRTPWEWAKQSLINDKDSRQAFIKFSLPEHQWMGNRDQVCTMHGNFLIRDDKLHLTIVMRSNDMVLGLVYDLPWFCSLLDKMVDELKPHYPNLKKGTYTHLAHSLHIYDKNEEMVKKMLGI